jgi:hypothetical protein
MSNRDVCATSAPSLTYGVSGSDFASTLSGTGWHIIARTDCLLLSELYIGADIAPRPAGLCLLEVTGMTGKPHRPSSTDGHLLVFVPLVPQTLSGYRKKMPVASARPYRGTLSLGRCGD